MKSLLKHNSLLWKSLILLFVASLHVACDKQVVYHAFQSLPTDGWSQQDTLFFTVMVPDSSALYGVSVEIRNRNNYPYQNLPLFLSCENPHAQNIQRDTLRLTLANDKSAWLGKGWGGLYQSLFPAGYIYIDKAGEYRFTISHLLPDEKVSGINDIGIRLKR